MMKVVVLGADKIRLLKNNRGHGLNPSRVGRAMSHPPDDQGSQHRPEVAETPVYFRRS